MHTQQRFTDKPIEYRSNGQLQIAGTAATVYDGSERTEFVLRPAGPGRKPVVERLLPGCFDAVLARQPDVRVLRNHQPDNLLGRTASGTAKVYKDSRGDLAYSCWPAETSCARDTIAQLKRGDLSGSSFAFTIAVENFREESGKGIVEVMEVANLYDVGPVTYPAYQATAAGVRQGNWRSVLGRYEAWEQKQTHRAGCDDEPLSVEMASYRLRVLACQG